MSRTLPAQANLEQLKKQAKDLLAAYRARDAAAVAEVRSHERSPDPERFALHDAQRVLARSYGFPSWPRLKAHVERITVARFADAVRGGDARLVRSMLEQRPELVHMESADSDEHLALHHAVLSRNLEMVKLLMAAGSDARKGIWPHRDATSAHTLAKERGYDDVVALIEGWEQDRREKLSCPNATITPEQDRLSAAIKGGDDEAALALLLADETLVQACDRDGASPLHAAAAACNQRLVAWLLENKANPRKPDARGFTPLDRAALAADPRNDRARRFPDVAQRLLDGGALLTLRGAVALGDLDVVREHLTREPGPLREPDLRRGGLVSLAVNHGQLAVIRLLKQLGADLDERRTLPEVEEPTPSWGQPLWFASRGGRTDVARLLLDLGADPNTNVYASDWPLDHAYAQKNEDLKRLLLERGAKPKPWTVTAVHDVEAARAMLARDSGEELAHDLAWGACLNGCPGIVELALPRMSWPPDDGRWNWFLVQPIRGHDRAEHEGLFQCMRLLLQRGLDVNLKNQHQETVLHYTMADGDPTEEQRVRFVEALLDAGARLDLRDALLKSTPLGWAARWGRRDVVELLLKRGAPAHEPDAEPWATPLAWATKRGHAEIAERLRSNGAVA